MPPSNQPLPPEYPPQAPQRPAPIGFSPESQSQPQYQQYGPQQVSPSPQQVVGSGSATQNPNQKDSQQAPKTKALSTQNTLLFSEIRDSMVIMADGSFRAVIACKSINFDLMSGREQEGIEYSYQNFLNALNFPIQIFIRSQQVDIGPYLDKLIDLRRNQENMLLGVLMDDYINYIDLLSEEANIMDKSFFVIVPFFPAGDASKVLEKGKGLFDGLFGGTKKNTTVTRIDKITYEKGKDEIRNRVDAVIAGLAQVGIQCAQLNTKQLGELYYNVYNPDTAVREPLENFNNVTSTFVRRGTRTTEDA